MCDKFMIVLPLIISFFQYVNKTFKAFQDFTKGGTAIFSMPPLPIKCPGAPQKIMYLFDDYLRNVSEKPLFLWHYVVRETT